jgi:sec-independent protein translocase protein TatA
MPNVGPFELAIVLIIALIVFGPKRLPELGKSLGKGIREFKGSINGEHDDEEPAKPAAEIEQPPPPPAESAPAPEKAAAPAEQSSEDEPVAHDRG